LVILYFILFMRKNEKKEELKTVFPELYLMNKTEIVSLY